MDHDNDLQLSFEYKNGVKCEWKQKDRQYEPYVYDGLEHHLATLDRLSNLPREVCTIQDGSFYKGNSDGTSWKLRYFYTRGGLLTYFKDKHSSQPKGTIPLKGCILEYPNDKRKSFIQQGRSGVNGYELKITHPSRRTFTLAFETSQKRDEWNTYLSKYIASSFVSAEYHLAEMVESVSNGLSATKQTGLIGIENEGDQIQDEPTQQYFYIDWYSNDPTQWCVRYSSQRLQLVPSTSGVANEYEFDSNFVSRTLPLHRISKVSQVDSPSKSIRFQIYNGSTFHPGGIGEFWLLVPSEESKIALWVHAFQCILKLQDINAPTQPHRRNSDNVHSLKAKLVAASEPVSYTRHAFVQEKYSIEHGNQFDLLGVGVKKLGRNLLMHDIVGGDTANEILEHPSPSQDNRNSQSHGHGQGQGHGQGHGQTQAQVQAQDEEFEKKMTAYDAVGDAGGDTGDQDDSEDDAGDGGKEEGHTNSGIPQSSSDLDTVFQFIEMNTSLQGAGGAGGGFEG